MLINNDCLKVLDSLGKYDCILTDPPYFVIPKGKKTSKGIDAFSWDNFKDIDDFANFTKLWFSKCKEHLEENSIMFIFWSQKYLKLGMDIFEPDRVLFWHYSNLVLGGNGDFAYDYEPIFVIKKGNFKLIPGKHSCILKYTKPQSNFKKDKLVHPTQKPLELIKHLLEVSNPKKVLDLFAGSGTTGVACKDLGIDFDLIERDINYFNIINERLKTI